ncbi:pseudouridine synthase [Gordonia pseudamarae]|jgi:tRNA pseudouridine32 synthase/23S rRNA pseudouridine746 synthase|uniref:RNA pseudouridylate synthase n=1 Tax=Gordonia pseudamarae TaxID=2831662 RepID=A0ABX6IM02_9ACTN|nr:MULTISPECIES: pseudouridine synthase [Gordonia]MBD0023784.1 pseudouridine synthase [Gordonia sp. (in: high G+C Gram-positive bacteria)]QHN28091.1 pseudouridine synthase [Gordonia pseudamarae]QHN36953.1 pseudouridine synthase [Gordonia pseudamarae]
MSRRTRPSPLPPRDGVDATRVVVRADGCSVGEVLSAAPSLAGLGAGALEDRARAGEIVDIDGRMLALEHPVRRNSTIFLYRDLPDEPPIPFDLPILYRDDNIVVVDKPHFLATMPRGRHVVQSALVRLRRDLGVDEIAPAHRLDRLTAGVLLFTLHPQVRAAYQSIFAQRRAVKEYRALAPARSGLADTVTVRNRIEKTAGDLRALVADGEINAVSEITLLGPGPGPGTDTGTDTGLYRLVPHTGRTHQLRLHMALLGVPIIDDPLYPDVRPDLARLPDDGDFTRPLRLLASSLAFDDPLTGERREFISALHLNGAAR